MLSFFVKKLQHNSTDINKNNVDENDSDVLFHTKDITDSTLSSLESKLDEFPSTNVSPISKEISVFESSSTSSTDSSKNEDFGKLDFSDPGNHKVLLEYLFGKVTSLEKSFADIAKENNQLREENLVLNNKVDFLTTINDETESVSSLEDSVTDETIKKLTADVKELQAQCARNQVNLLKNNDEFADINSTFDKNVAEIYKEIHRIDCYAIKTSQYGRRNNLIIDGIPDMVKGGRRLEDTCIDIVSRLVGFEITRKDVEGCHRLRKDGDQQYQPTIIRFVNRKVKEISLRNKRFFVENWLQVEDVFA